MLFSDKLTNLKPPGDIFVSPDDSLQARKSDEAYRDLDTGLDPIQQSLPLRVPSAKHVRLQSKEAKTKLGVMLRAERARMGVTHREIAEATGLSRQQVGRLEQGLPPVPKLDQLMKLVDFYGLDKDTVLRVLAQIERKEKSKAQPTQENETDNPFEGIGRDEPEDPFETAESPEDILDIVRSESRIRFKKEYLLNSILRLVSILDEKNLLELANYLGYPVELSKDLQFYFKIAMHCPFCTKVINPDTFEMCTIPNNVDGLRGMCDCGNTVVVTISDIIASATGRKII